MAEIVLQFVEGSGFSSALIKWFGSGLYSHVDTVLPDGTLLGARNDVIQGIPAGVQIRPANYIQNEAMHRVSLTVSGEMRGKYYAFLHSQIGKPYNRLGIFAFFINAEWSDIAAWFCSQLVTAALQDCQWMPELSQPASKIDPDRLFLLISALVKTGK